MMDTLLGLCSPGCFGCSLVSLLSVVIRRFSRSHGFPLMMTRYLVCRHRPELQVQTTPEEGTKGHIWSLNWAADRDLPHT